MKTEEQIKYHIKSLKKMCISARERNDEPYEISLLATIDDLEWVLND